MLGEAREFKKDISAESIYFKYVLVSFGVQEDQVKFGSKHKKGAKA